MLAFEELCSRAVADTKPYRWVVQQATCRACGNVHERELGLMREHAPGSWIRVLELNEQTAHKDSPVEFQQCVMAWCEGCHSKSAQELTKLTREALDMYSNSDILATRLKRILHQYEIDRKKEHFHHAS